MGKPRRTDGTKPSLESGAGCSKRRKAPELHEFFDVCRFGAVDAFEKQITGGEGGIRTLGTRKRTHTFQACSLSHSDTSPQGPEGYTTWLRAAIACALWIWLRDLRKCRAVACGIAHFDSKNETSIGEAASG
jgi:hypothetical protein